MKFSCLIENLNKALSTVSRTINTKSALPVLSHVHISAEKGSITLSTTNLEIGVKHSINGKVDENGGITVPARILNEFISSLPGGKIEIETKDLLLAAKTPGTSVHINGGDAAEFPLIPDIKKNYSFSLKIKDFKEAIELVTIATALDETRPVLSGVLMKTEGKKCILAATDSYRLSEKVVNLSKTPEKAFSVIVPARTLNEVSRILSDMDGEVEIFISDNQISFKIGENIELVSRLVEGQFPNYLQIIPESSQTKAEMELTSLVSALKVAYLFARENANTVKLELREKTGLEITAVASQVGDTISSVPAEITGEDGEISLNVKYLLDVLNIIKQDKVNLEINGKLNPAMVRPASKERDFLYIIMPLRS